MTIAPVNTSQFLTKAKLKERGWTDKLIKQFLPVPDKTKINPHYRSGPPMSLYQLERVEAAENPAKFKLLATTTATRKQSARKAVETKTAKMLEYVNAVVINVPKMTKGKLTEQACNHYNRMQRDREQMRDLYDGEGSRASIHDDGLFLNRISVNYLRHQLTSYEEHLDKISGKVGVGQAYTDIKTKVLNVIATTYPFLVVECNRQIAKLHEETSPRSS